MGNDKNIIKFQAFGDRSWAGTQKAIQRDLRSRGYNEEVIKNVIVNFEFFWKEYANRRTVVHIPEEKVRDKIYIEKKYLSKLVNIHIKDLTNDMLNEIVVFCLLLENLK